jgi:hypothetical protein
MMYLAYLDESYGTRLSAMSLLLVPAEEWNATFDALHQFRRDLRNKDGIQVRRELHATLFVNGRGRLGNRMVPKSRRWDIFLEALFLLAGTPSLSLMGGVCLHGSELRLLERLVNRLQRKVKSLDSQALLISDAGHELEYTRLVRRLRVYNPIPSAYGVWETGQTSTNIPADRIIEDPVFRDSRNSYFIQMADFCAYALLRREEPIADKRRFGLERAFEFLEPILVKEANSNDPLGIVRL